MSDFAWAMNWMWRVGRGKVKLWTDDDYLRRERDLLYTRQFVADTWTFIPVIRSSAGVKGDKGDIHIQRRTISQNPGKPLRSCMNARQAERPKDEMSVSVWSQFKPQSGYHTRDMVISLFLILWRISQWCIRMISDVLRFKWVAWYVLLRSWKIIRMVTCKSLFEKLKLKSILIWIVHIIQGYWHSIKLLGYVIASSS